jgi:anaerobic selenocysteine-containing dehydrogenase
MPVVEHRNTVCPLDCPDSCGMIARLVDGRITALTGDPQHPYTAGTLCRKMRRYPERLYSEERLLFPGIRRGTKGEGRFSRISWDEALGLAAERLLAVRNRYGGEAILRYSYAGNMGALNRFAGHALFHKLGASRLEETICSAAAAAGWEKHCGSSPGTPPEQAAEAELIIAWGINIRVSNTHFWRYVTAARKRGGRLLVIDPYRNETAARADLHCPVKPGGDVALALGLLKSLAATGRLDRDRLDRESHDFSRLEGYLQGLGWGEVVAESGIERHEIAALAERLAATPATFLRIGIGLTRNSRGGMAVRAITALAAALGLFAGGKGRGVLLSSRAFRADTTRLTCPELAPPNLRRINMVQLGHALNRLEPPLKALMVYNSNPASVTPDGTMVRRGLAREDLFTVVHEQVMTPTARYADLLLPATTFLENRDIYTGYGHFYLRVVEPVIAPLGEARSNFALFQDLAKAMGFSDPPFRQSLEERLRHYLAGIDGIPSGIDPATVLAGELVQSSYGRVDVSTLEVIGGRFPFAVGDGTTDAAIPCLGKAGEYDDPDLRARFPLRLLSPPHRDLLNSTFGERFANQCGEVLVHPEDARRSCLVDQEEALLVNHRGSSRRRVRVTTDTREGVVVAEGIFWSGDSATDGGINDLTSGKLADMGGGATFHEARVALVPFGRDGNRL